MKTFIIFLAFFVLALLISAKPKINSNKDENFSKTDTVSTGYTKSNTPDFFDSTDYSIEIQDSSGITVKLDNWRGRNLLIIYAHSDCPYCQELVKKYEAEIQNTALQVIVLFSGQNRDEIKEFRKETSLKYAYFIDSAFQFRRKYGAGIVPVTLFINSDGTAERIAGLKHKEVETLIQKINKS
jgi:peroxiredoxin